MPITILSGYRCERLNAAVNGSATSDHVKACAADIGSCFWEAAGCMLENTSGHVDELGIGQLINEFRGPSGWVHVSTKKPAKADQPNHHDHGSTVTAGVSMTRIAVCIAVVLAFAWACVEFGKDIKQSGMGRGTHR